jgi:hypothetical protein
VSLGYQQPQEENKTKQNKTKQKKNNNKKEALD